MALVKCKECGHSVSDKASICPNCGCPVEKELVCSECGLALSSTDRICPNCGNPISGHYVEEKTARAFPKIVKYILIVALLGGVGYGSYCIFKQSRSKPTVEVASADSLSEEKELTAEELEEERKIEAAKQSYLEREQQREQEERGWLYGTWRYDIEGGAYLKATINASQITETMFLPSRGETTNIRSYYIDGDRLYTDKTKYRLDRVNKRLLGDDGSPYNRVSNSTPTNTYSNANTNTNSNANSETNHRIARLERKAQDDINELNAMVSSGRMHPTTMMYLKQNLPSELTELMEYYASQGNSVKYNDYAYKKRVVLGVFRDIGM